MVWVKEIFRNSLGNGTVSNIDGNKFANES